MDLAVGIAGDAMALKSLSFQQDYAIAVTKKAMETQELAGQELARMLSAMPPKGAYVDVYA